MKLPRLGNPTVIKTVEQEFLGDRIETEITYASQFDLMPTWLQWCVLCTPVCSIVLIIFIMIFVVR